jgi:hypothetical protein
VNYGFREEYGELIDIINDASFTKQKVKVTAATNEEIKARNYDALLIAISGYRSNFMFDMYDIYLREPDLASHKISLVTTVGADGKTVVDPKSFEAGKNFFRLDLAQNSPEHDMANTLLTYVYNFMSTKEIGDKQAYAVRIDSLEQNLALSSWMFSLPSLAYFSMQFDPNTIDLYGVASQLSTIEKWQEIPKK